ncbi:MAG: hypothetical protein CL610_12635 [Anaerolineaceae bacterium]|nr:hypothetical protein [Anaerolineaceae bacterium]
MTLPGYADWKDAKTALHAASQILNAVRVASLDPLPNALRHSLRPIPAGATTGPLKAGGSLTLDYLQGAIIYAHDGTDSMPVALNGNSQQSLFNTIVAAMTQTGHQLEPDRAKITSDEPFNLDLTQAQLYAEVQWRMFQMLAVVKASMYGPQHPLVLWPHGFDLSVLWFADGMDEGADLHLNIGFSPGTPDIGQPYVYFYAQPEVEDLRTHIPRQFQWITGWHAPGGYITYDQFATEREPETMLAELLIEVYRTASGMIRSG